MDQHNKDRRRILSGLTKAGALAAAGLGVNSVLGFAATAARAASASDVGVTPDTIRIGMTAGISGPIAFASRQFSGYMQKEFERINANGGVLGRKLQLVVYDDGGKGDVALQNAQRLLQQDQVFAITTIGTATTAGILEYLTRQNVPLLFPAALNSELINPPRPNTFALYQPYDGQAAALTKWAMAKMGKGRAVIIRATPPVFDPVAAAATKAVQAAGGTVEATLNTTYGQPEWSSVVIRLRQIKPDYIILMTTATDMGRLWKEMSQQKVFPAKATLGVSPLADQAFLDTAGAVPDNVVYAAVPATVVTTAAEANEARKVMPGEKMGVFGLSGVLSAAVMAEAFRQVGPDLTRAKLIKLLDGGLKPFKLPYADTAKSAPNHLLIQGISIATVKGGDFVPATNEFVAP